MLKNIWFNPILSPSVHLYIIHIAVYMCSHMCSLQDNTIGDRGAISVAAGLRSNHSLRNLRQEPNFACVDIVHVVIREGGREGRED